MPSQNKIEKIRRTHTRTQVFRTQYTHAQSCFVCGKINGKFSFVLRATYDVCRGCGIRNAILDAFGILWDATANSSCSPVSSVLVMVVTGAREHGCVGQLPIQF